jgi:peroxiredoxin
MRVPFVRVLVTLPIIIVTLAQGADSERIRIGQAKPNWRNLPGVDGKMHSLADLNRKTAVVVAITCNHCPIALEYFDRLKAFTSHHGEQDGKVALVAVSLSDLETDKLPRMKELAAKYQLNFAYLHDASQRIGKELGATVTPQFFVLNQDRKLVYRGAWDDNVNASKVKTHYVEDAVAAVLVGKQPAQSETKARGCSITYR